MIAEEPLLHLLLFIFSDAPNAAAKTVGVHSSFPVFVRIAYVWL